MDSLCDTALKVACLAHTFKDTLTTPADVAITEDATTLALPSGTREIITVRIVDSADDRSAPLPLRNRTWWDRFVVTPEDNMKGWPQNALRFGSNLIIDRPSEANKSARFRISSIPTFTTGSTECPIEILDIFVEYFVTSHVFMSLEDKENYAFWMEQAIGTRGQKARNTLGGALKEAIDADMREPAEVYDIVTMPNVKRQPTLATSIIGDNFYGDFANLSGAQWF
jgi:hypothetical protein